MRRTVWLALGVILLGRALFGATQLISNGGFESVSVVPWQIVGDPGSTPLFNPLQSHSGSYFLTMGNANGPSAQGVFQVITIPTNAIVVPYTYFWNVSSIDAGGAVKFRALIVNTNVGQTILSNLD